MAKGAGGSSSWRNWARRQAAGQALEADGRDAEAAFFGLVAEFGGESDAAAAALFIVGRQLAEIDADAQPGIGQQPPAGPGHGIDEIGKLAEARLPEARLPFAAGHGREGPQGAFVVAQFESDAARGFAGP